MWKQDKLDAQLAVVRRLAGKTVISGGLAWHLMSPEHAEEKRLHDHKDVDLFVAPEHFPEVATILKDVLGFERLWTKYDGMTKGFYRYGRSFDRPADPGRPDAEPRHVKVLIDLFVARVPGRPVGDLVVVEPRHLLTLYERTHSSKECVAVVSAARLLAAGIDPVGRPELVGRTTTETQTGKRPTTHVRD